MSGDEGIRLAKYVAAMLPCSRREAELYIEGGWVSVNGSIVHSPAMRVIEGQNVKLLAGARPDAIAPVTILYNKPAGEDAAGMKGLVEAKQSGLQTFLPKHLQNQKLLTPLDTMGSGLVVYSQDFRVVRKLTEDADKLEQEFIVDVSGQMLEDGLARLNQSVSVDGKAIAPMKVSWQSESRLRFALKGARPGQIVAICQTVGLKVEALRRIRIGRLPMAGLEAGSWRYLQSTEKF